MSEVQLRRRARDLAKRAGLHLVCVRSDRWAPDFRRGEYIVKEGDCVAYPQSMSAAQIVAQYGARE